MRRISLPLLALLVLLPAPSQATARAKTPQVTALICSLDYDDRGAADGVALIRGVISAAST